MPSVDLVEATLRHLAGDVFGDQNPHVVADVLSQLLPVCGILAEVEGILHGDSVRYPCQRHCFDPLTTSIAEKLFHAFIELMRKGVPSRIWLSRQAGDRALIDAHTLSAISRQSPEA